MSKDTGAFEKTSWETLGESCKVVLKNEDLGRTLRKGRLVVVITRWGIKIFSRLFYVAVFRLEIAFHHFQLILPDD